jgi:hypothetical protein
MDKTKQLLDLVIDAHGGLDRWNKLTEVKTFLSVGGLTWAYKGQEGVLSEVGYRALLHKQYGSYTPFVSEDQRSIFERGRVAIEKLDGTLVEELLNPRESFLGHTRETKWNKLQLVYFASYAMWSYLTLPFNFTMPGFYVVEIEPWTEGGEIWRRLEVHFPDYIETHSKKQVFYYGPDGLLRRHDYWAEVLGGLPAAHYVSDYREFSGIMVPTKRRVYSLNEDNSYKPEPVFVAIDVLDITFI